MEEKWLDIPTMSQHNSVHDTYLGKENRFPVALLHDRSEVEVGVSGTSDGWCGRASASMIYNYFQLIAAYTKAAAQ